MPRNIAAFLDSSSPVYDRTKIMLTTVHFEPAGVSAGAMDDAYSDNRAEIKH